MSDEEYEVEKVLDKRVKKGNQVEYLVKLMVNFICEVDGRAVGEVVKWMVEYLELWLVEYLFKWMLELNITMCH